MQLQDLNKSQIVLLTLLISFVTSIATGIMTVSLLQEAPLEVTRNIHQIVEKTIETVTAPSTDSSSSGQKEVTTVVVKEEDQVLSSIDKNVKSIVRIHEKDGVTSISTFYGIGLVISKDGLIAADRKTITAINIYTAIMSDNVEFKLVPMGVSKDTNFLLFKAVLPEKGPAYAFIPASLGDATPKLGQTLIGLGGDESNSVAVGRVLSLDMKDSGVGTSTVKYLAGINTDISTTDLVPGSPVFNLSGDVVGMRLSLNDPKSFTPVSILKKELPDLQKTQ
jgi:S1-C subfamily serine protease